MSACHPLFNQLMAHSESNDSRSRSRSSARSGKGEERKRSAADAEDNTCLYIGNIDKRLSQEKLVAAFQEFGQLEYCYIVYEPYSASDRGSRSQPKQSRGYGFAKFKQNDDALRAKEKLQGADIGGRRISVEVSKRTKPREPTPGRYLGKKRQSPPHKSRKRSYSPSSSRSRSKSHRRSRRYHDKKRRHDRSRSRSDSYRRRRSYSKSPRR